LTQVGAPAVGEVLADRYRLEEHIQDDSTGRQVWRGVDVILRRPVTIVLKYPGGGAAEDMLQAAVAASRVIHPHTVGVYDAVDEGDRAYVVREWVDGRSLRDVVAESPLSPARATAVAHAIADALAAVHETGVAHGNVHAGTVLLDDDERIVLADASAGADVSAESDVRALGGVLYCALTGDWPQQLPGGDHLPPAPQLDGRLASPRQIRAGVPSYLDALTMDLLDPALPPPTAAELSSELGRLDLANEVSGPLDIVSGEHPTAVVPQQTGRPVWKKLAVGIAALVTISLLGLLLGNKLVSSSQHGGDQPSGSSSPSAQSAGPPQLKVSTSRLVDPNGDGGDPQDTSPAIDGNPNTGWKPDEYDSADFGGLKPGMGILLDLGSTQKVSTVEVDFANAGATVQILYGTSDPGNGSQSKASDNQILNTFQKTPSVTGSSQTPIQLGDVSARYLVVWITQMPQISDGKYQTTVDEVVVRGH
jgi:eukaryotic-like serine/threonine-protein kinase